ncbi:MAG: hypothetical protein QXW45_06910 [Thermosphaera sp.]
MEGLKFEPVIWYIGVVNVIRPNKKKGTPLSLGYCTYGKGIAFVALSNIDPLTITSVDISIKDGTATCGDARWCFNLKCPLNRAEPDKFKVFDMTTWEEIEKAHNFLEKVVEQLRAMYGEEIFDKQGGLIIFDKGAPLVVYAKK